ncbi:MAG: hypothetical protein HYY16_17990 [Planctomycetes bacterium]|nr:hypothetical protein [Planctomycetota bacterium]
MGKPIVAIAVDEIEIESCLAVEFEALSEVRVLSRCSPLAVVKALYESPANVLVIDRLASADLVDLLRSLLPRMRIVFCVSRAAMEDAAIVERGVHFYAAGLGMSMLKDVVRAALNKSRNGRSFPMSMGFGERAGGVRTS